MIAIILAAGTGRRLKLTKPKGMLNIGDRPLIDYSIESLYHAGVKEIIVVTGFEAESYISFFGKKNNPVPIRFIHNPKFDVSGNLYTLYLALKSIERYDDLVILDSDILYNVNEFVEFMKMPYPESTMATNVPLNRYDACYVEVNISGHLIKISKNIESINPSQNSEYWEYIGITKTSSATIDVLINYAESKFELNSSLDYEYDYAFENTGSYKVIKFPDYVWSEVDDNQQLHYMLTEIYPKLNLYY